MKKVLMMLVVLLAFSSCQKEAANSTKVGQFNVELLFEIDGCKIYRFEDFRTVYFSDCRGTITSDYIRSTGKSHIKVYEETLNLGRGN